MSIPRQDATPCPPGFAYHFIRDGWRGVERVYGASTPLLLKWFAAAGGKELEQRRREHYRAKIAPPAVPALRRQA